MVFSLRLISVLVVNIRESVRDSWVFCSADVVR